jgi:hypothetical protein
MSESFVVKVRITLLDILATEVRRPTGDRKAIRRNESPHEAYVDGDWIYLPAQDGRGKPAKEWEVLWDDLHVEVEIQQIDTSWRMIDAWEEIDAIIIASVPRKKESI